MRAGRMTPAQERGWQAGFPRFGLTLQAGQLDWDQTFGFAGQRVVEIGFGMGDILLYHCFSKQKKQVLQQFQ